MVCRFSMSCGLLKNTHRLIGDSQIPWSIIHDYLLRPKMMDGTSKMDLIEELAAHWWRKIWAFCHSPSICGFFVLTSALFDLFVCPLLCSFIVCTYTEFITHIIGIYNSIWDIFGLRACLLNVHTGGEGAYKRNKYKEQLKIPEKFWDNCFQLRVPWWVCSH